MTVRTRIPGFNLMHVACDGVQRLYDLYTGDHSAQLCVDVSRVWYGEDDPKSTAGLSLAASAQGYDFTILTNANKSEILCCVTQDKTRKDIKCNLV